jgi:hypothetical protein
MNANEMFPRLNSSLARLLMLGIVAMLLHCVPAHADLMEISIQSPISVSTGTSGNGFDVVLKNLSGPAASIAAFTFEISIASTDLTFTGANTSTLLDPYIFNGNSLFGPDITVANTGQDLSASDIFSIPASGIMLGTGGSVGLGHISFDVSSTAPTETLAVALLAFPATSLSDELANNVPISALIGGQIQVTAAVPEPSSLLMVLTVVPLFFYSARRLRP